MFIKYFLIPFYITMALITAGLTLNDAVACHHQERPDSSYQLPGRSAGIDSFFTGLFWPVTFPGMIAVYDDHDGLFCS